MDDQHSQSHTNPQEPGNRRPVRGLVVREIRVSSPEDGDGFHFLVVMVDHFSKKEYHCALDRSTFRDLFEQISRALNS